MHFNQSKGVLFEQVLSTTNLTKKYPILQRISKEKKQMCQSSCLVGFSFDHRSLKIGAFNVERIFTCHWLVELWQEVVNLKNEIDRK
jgi:hypothetical protein